MHKAFFSLSGLSLKTVVLAGIIVCTLLMILVPVYAQFGGVPLGGGGFMTFLDPNPSCESLCGEGVFPESGLGCTTVLHGQPTLCNCGGGNTASCPSGTYCWDKYWWCAATEEEAAQQYCEEKLGWYWQESIQECYECETSDNCQSPEVCSYDDNGIKVCGNCDFSQNHCNVCNWKWLNVPGISGIYSCFKPCVSNSDCLTGQSCAFLSGEKVCADPSTSQAHCEAAGGNWIFAGAGSCDFSCDAVGWTSACGCASPTECKDTSLIGTCTFGGSTSCPEGWYCAEDAEGKGSCQPPNAGEKYCEAAGLHWDPSTNSCCEASGYHWDNALHKCCEPAGGEWDEAGYWAESKCLFQRSLDFCYDDPDAGAKELFQKNNVSFVRVNMKAPQASLLSDVDLENKIIGASTSGDDAITSYIISWEEYSPKLSDGTTLEDFCVEDMPQQLKDAGFADLLPSGTDIIELKCSNEMYSPRECQWGAECKDGACIMPEGKCIDNEDCSEGEVCYSEQCTSVSGEECSVLGPLRFAQVGDQTYSLDEAFGDETPKVVEGTVLAFAVAGSQGCTPESAELIIGENHQTVEVSQEVYDTEDYGTLSMSYVTWTAEGDGKHVSAVIKLKDQEPVNVGDVIICAENSNSPECTAGEVYTGCGDGICAEEETAETCPQDCAGTVVEPPEYQNETFPVFGWSNALIVIFLVVAYYAYSGIRKREE